MAEAALRNSRVTMAEGTPRKRSRDPEGSCSPFQTPDPKRLRGFPRILSPSQNSRDELLPSQTQCSPNSQEENKENSAFPGKSAQPRRLEISPILPAENRESPGKPSSQNSHKSHVPVGAFYGKIRSYLDPLERKKLRELQGNGVGNSLGKTNGNSRNSNRNPNPSRNSNRNPSRNLSKNPKSKSNPRKIQSVPTEKQEKAKIPEARKSGNFGQIPEKKAEYPRKVLSAGIRPALRLPLGSAFFLPGRKSHSRKNPGESKGIPRIPQGTPQPGAARLEKLEKSEKSGILEGNGTVEVKEGLGRNVELREEKENREKSLECGNSRGKSAGKSAGDSQDGAAGSRAEESSGILSSGILSSGILSPGILSSGILSPGILSSGILSSSPQSKDSLSIPKPAKGSKELAFPAQPGLYPIFIPSRKRPLDELPTPFADSPSCQRSRRAKESSQDCRDQMIIDAGQRRFGAVQCRSCGMLYAPAVAEDQLQHLRHHRRLREGLRYLGWKKERVVAEFWDGKIVLILPGDPKYAVRKAEEVREIVDNELGFQPVALRHPDQTRIYLFVSPGKTILGCLVAEGISQAFRVLSEPSPASLPDSQENSQNSQENSQNSQENSQGFPRAWRCSLDPEPAVCGISRIWVLGMCRRRGIARRMVDVLRQTFLFGTILNSRDLAFSDPTPDGRGFASRYCGDPNFLVYNFLHNSLGSSMGSGLGSMGSSMGSSVGSSSGSA